MKESLPKWLIGIAGLLLIGAISVYGFMSIKRASEPEIDRSKPPQSVIDSYTGRSAPRR